MIDYDPNSTVSRITLMLNRKGKTKAELNEFCGISKDTIYQSGNSKNGLSAKVLFNVAEFLQCPVDYLLGRDGYGYDLKKQEVIKLSSLNNQDQRFIADERAAGNNPTFDDLAQHRNDKHNDPMIEEFIKQFNNLDFANKVKTMNYVLDLLEK